MNNEACVKDMALKFEDTVITVASKYTIEHKLSTPKKKLSHTEKKASSNKKEKENKLKNKLAEICKSYGKDSRTAR